MNNELEDGERSVYSEKRNAKTKRIIRKSSKVASVIGNMDVEEIREIIRRSLENTHEDSTKIIAHSRAETVLSIALVDST